MMINNASINISGNISWILLGIFLPCISFADELTVQNKIKEIGVVCYKNYLASSSQKSITQELIACLKEFGCDIDLIDESTFLKINRDKCASYKRIIIPAMTNLFSYEMYEGMTEYVKNGGLLITNESAMQIDANQNYRNDSEDRYWEKDGFPLIGVYGSSSCNMIKMKILQHTPLTKELPLNEWIELNPSAGGRECKIIKGNAIELISAYLSDDSKGYRPMKQPLMTYNHSGYGACIYITPRINIKMDKTLKIILKNLLSENTLEWLTSAPEESEN